ncbi:acyl-CoA dehydrogenase family protein [Geodermatophilus sp. URMC 62]|uniref:acyl-CoA dehydrogenase family protein n=1 Tax=Geodermatophilus sp. URMC 62 TaxID=3423414 RepID=UPI00406CA57D
MVEFEFTAEQRALREVARDVCTRSSPEAEVRRLMGTPEGFDRAVWRRLGSDVGLLGLAVPEEHGGAGAGLVELALLAEETGRTLLGGPLLGTVALAVPALLVGGDAALAAELLPSVLDGSTVLALAATDDRGGWAPAQPSVTADGGTLTGGQAHVLDGAAADALLVLAAGEHGPALYLVDGDAPGLTREVQSGLDLTRRQARLRFDGVPARPAGSAADAADAVATARRTAAVVLAAAAVGSAQRLLDSAVEHARTRLQFGRPIGSFQAVKHRCADMLVDVEHARSAAYHAAWAADEGTDDPGLAADLATVVTTEAHLRVARGTVQVHGGIGFTWEHPTHLHYKRAVSDAALLGGRAAAAARLADAVLEPA